MSVLTSHQKAGKPAHRNARPRDGETRSPRAGRSAEIDRRSGLPFDVIESKVRVPLPRPGVISRTALVNRLRASASIPIVAIVAPAGYGKTTLLTQWVERDARPSAWVSIDERDNDPVVLLRHVGAALHEIEPLSASVFEALESPGSSIWHAAVPRLGSAMSSVQRPFVLVLDDADALRPGDPVDAVAVLAEHLPGGSTLVVAGRTMPRLSIGALRTRGRLLEIGPDLLALTLREARRVLHAAGVELPKAHETALIERTEGWPAAVYLAALSLMDGGDENGGKLRGDERYLADYIRSECLAHLTPKHLTFLRRTSVLPRMRASLCNHVLESQDSARVLESIEEANLFLVPLDRNREWLRYPRLIHEVLRRELTEREPELVSTLNRRAADWFEANGEHEAAVEAAAASDDPERVARLVTTLGVGVWSARRTATLEAWLDRLDGESKLEQYPALGVVGAWIHALSGRPDAAERWLASVEGCPFEGALPDGSTSLRPWIALVRAALCRDGVDQMLADAEAALAELPADSRWRPTALLLQGAAWLLLGDDERGDAILADAAASAARVGATDARAAAIGERALVAASRNDHAAAEALVHEAHDIVPDGRLETGVTSALALAASARLLLRRSHWDEARAELTSVQRSTQFLTCALPWIAVQVHLELARAYVTLRDTEAARTLLAEIDEILRLRPRLGVLPKRRDELQADIGALCNPGAGNGSGLTRAELRLLPILTTHLSFREIGERLYVSSNTIKTHANSIYRKLGVSGRSEAIDLAARVGLVDIDTRLSFVSRTPAHQGERLA